MRVLHTADWHLGHIIYGYDRESEQRAMLRQIRDTVIDQAPDVTVICGDIFHTAQPSAATQSMFVEAIMGIHNVRPDMPIIITAGNHDSGTRHETFRLPWHSLNVHVIGTIDRDNPSRHIIEIPGKGFVIAVPYTFSRNLPDGFFQSLLDRVSVINTDGLPVIMTAHTTVSGCDRRGHDDVTDFSAGGIDAVPYETFGTGYDYLALGHIHNAQTIAGTGARVRYSGTPLSINFDENRKHTITIADIHAHGDNPTLSDVEIFNPVPLVTLPAEGFAKWEKCLTLLKDFPDDVEAYIRLNVETDSFLPAEANNTVRALTAKKKCRFCHINTRRILRDRTTEDTPLTVHELQTESPIDIARHFAEQTGAEFDETMTTLFSDILSEVRESLREP